MSHGLRKTYASGCHCVLCKRANADYQARRDAFGPYLVSAERARKHLRRLKGTVGLVTVADITGIHIVRLGAIRSGKTRSIRPERERVILNVDANAADIVSAKEVHRMTKELLKEGFTHRSLGERMGLNGPFRIQRKDFVRAKTQMRLEKFYNKIMAEAA